MVDAQDLMHRYKAIKGDRSNWETHWEEIAERVLPRQRGFVGDRTDGEKKQEKVFDSRPMIALDRFASVMDSMLTPRAQKWHNIKASDEALNREFEVQDWFYQANNILYSTRYSPKANFAGQNFERWISMGAFGTGSLFIDFQAGTGLRYRCVNLRDTYLMENHQGAVDTVYREFQFTARQAVQRWGEKMMPEHVLKALENPESVITKSSPLSTSLALARIMIQRVQMLVASLMRRIICVRAVVRWLLPKVAIAAFRIRSAAM